MTSLYTQSQFFILVLHFFYLHFHIQDIKLTPSASLKCLNTENTIPIHHTKEVLNIYKYNLSRYQKLETQIKDIQEQIRSLPAGELCCASNGKYQKWYHLLNNTQVYIPKRNREFAELLAYKKYLYALLDDLSQEKHALQLYLRKHPVFSKSKDLLLHPEYNCLLHNTFQSQSEELIAWSQAPYDHNPKYPENLIHKSCSGNLLRSKSETIIDMMLYIHKIPFRYECALNLDNTTVFPDFTIRHPVTGDYYYWEHFGMMDNPSYSSNTFSKLQLYISHGILPFKNLITTHETTDTPLDIQTVERIIKLYFLE